MTIGHPHQHWLKPVNAASGYNATRTQAGLYELLPPAFELPWRAQFTDHDGVITALPPRYRSGSFNSAYHSVLYHIDPRRFPIRWTVRLPRSRKTPA